MHTPATSPSNSTVSSTEAFSDGRSDHLRSFPLSGSGYLLRRPAAGSARGPHFPRGGEAFSDGRSDHLRSFPLSGSGYLLRRPAAGSARGGRCLTRPRLAAMFRPCTMSETGFREAAGRSRSNRPPIGPGEVPNPATVGGDVPSMHDVGDRIPGSRRKVTFQPRLSNPQNVSRDQLQEPWERPRRPGTALSAAAAGSKASTSPTIQPAKRFPRSAARAVGATPPTRYRPFRGCSRRASNQARRTRQHRQPSGRRRTSTANRIRARGREAGSAGYPGE